MADFALYYENKAICEKVAHIFNKNTCKELFVNCKINGQDMYTPQVCRRTVEFKNRQKARIEKYKKVQLIVRLKAVNGIEFIKFNIAKI